MTFAYYLNPIRYSTKKVIQLVNCRLLSCKCPSRSISVAIAIFKSTILFRSFSVQDKPFKDSVVLVGQRGSSRCVVFLSILLSCLNNQ